VCVSVCNILYSSFGLHVSGILNKPVGKYVGKEALPPT